MIQNINHLYYNFIHVQTKMDCTETDLVKIHLNLMNSCTSFGRNLFNIELALNKNNCENVENIYRYDNNIQLDQ